MECHDIRVLMALLRRGDAIDPTERAALQQHLDACPECAGFSHSEQVIDAALGNAMRAVVVPAGLQARVRTRLAVTRPRRWPSVAAAAAVLLLIAGSAWFVVSPRPTRVDDDIVMNEVNGRRGMGANDVEDWYAAHGIQMTTWREADHQYLWTCDIVEFRGRRVPKLTFCRDGDDGRPIAIANVLVLSTKQFDTHDLQIGEANGSTISVQRPSSDFVYVIASNPADSWRTFQKNTQ